MARVCSSIEMPVGTVLPVLGHVKTRFGAMAFLFSGERAPSPRAVARSRPAPFASLHTMPITRDVVARVVPQNRADVETAFTWLACPNVDAATHDDGALVILAQASGERAL